MRSVIIGATPRLGTAVATSLVDRADAVAVRGDIAEAPFARIGKKMTSIVRNLFSPETYAELAGSVVRSTRGEALDC